MKLLQELYFDSQKIMQDLQTSIKGAKKSIEIEVYILKQDVIGDLFIQLLIEAAGRGVRVRLLVDGFGSWDWIEHKYSHFLGYQNFEIRIFNRIPHLWDFITQKTLTVFTLNRRNHRKLYFIDQEILFLGSFNLTTDTMSWQESGLCTRDKRQIEIARELFDYTWRGGQSFISKIKEYSSLRIEKEILRDSVIFTTQTLKLRRQYKRAFLNRLKQAENRLWLVTPYFNPTPSFVRHLKKAAKREVDVRLILPRQSDVIVLSWMARLRYKNLLKAGVKIYEYQTTFIHAKVALIDREVIMGSGNLNYRSFMRDLEINMILKHSDLILKVEKFFQECFEQSAIIKEAKKLSLWKLMISKILMTFKTWF